MTETWNWRIAARCRVADADTLFTRGRVQREARQFCTACPVRTECLAHALDHQIDIGVWGGMTERQRRALLKQRPQVASWTELLQSARQAYYAALADAAASRDGDASAAGCSVVESSAVENRAAENRAAESTAPTCGAQDAASSTGS
ncbi:WhiB family transcriptional regulator [Pseudonocardia sp.]|uniref:WhiB family transcriptional regulator n=1 Tax=Pseudonocardia sp. TaxID=60912 RepID=UPI003D0CC9F1